jgi:O-antigen/teichoic acid export membrane protein
MLGLLLVVAWMQARNRPGEITTVTSVYQPSEWSSLAFQFWILIIFRQVMQQVGTLFLGTFHGPAVAGAFFIVMRVASLVSMGLIASNVVLAPQVSKLYAQRRLEELRSSVRTNNSLILLTCLPLSLFLVVAGWWVLSFFGEVQSRTYVSLIILVVGQLVNALCGSVGLLLNMTGHHKDTTRTLALSALLSLLLHLLLVPWLGILGAALASSTTTIFWNLHMSWKVYRRLQFNPMRLGWR